jgi:hypothetical protein
MIEPMTEEEAHKIVSEAVARARRVPSHFDRPAPTESLAQKRAAVLFSTPLPLGGAPLSREEIHERRRLR